MCKNLTGFNAQLNKMHNTIVYYKYIYVCINYIVCDNDLEYQVVCSFKLLCLIKTFSNQIRIYYIACSFILNYIYIRYVQSPLCILIMIFSFLLMFSKSYFNPIHFWLTNAYFFLRTAESTAQNDTIQGASRSNLIEV